MNWRTTSDGEDAPGAIRLDRVSVCYRIERERIFSFKEVAIRWLQGGIAKDEFWALRDIDLDIRAGEVFGVIGRNGAGKSTLLKVIARVLRPSRGRVRLNGRIAPLLELGAGFDLELTGRENVFMNGAILGYSRADIASRFDRIVEFAGLRDFIDRPLRTYSNGMVARLGFSVATDAQPEILLIDEVLAVGDAEFGAQSAQRIRDFQSDGTTIILVTHDLAAVERMCQRAAWLAKGRIEAVGGAGDVVERYRRSVAPCAP